MLIKKKKYAWFYIYFYPNSLYFSEQAIAISYVGKPMAVRLVTNTIVVIKADGWFK